MKSVDLVGAARQVARAKGLAQRLAALAASTQADWKHAVATHHDLDRVLSDLHSALVWAESANKSAEKRADAAEADSRTRVTEHRDEVVVSSLEAALMSPHGFFVYLLVSPDGEVLYVGRSTNLLSRLGQHMGNPERRNKVGSIAVIRCGTKSAMAETENGLISDLRPPWNVLGVAADPT